MPGAPEARFISNPDVRFRQLKLWHFALLGACSLGLSCLGPLVQPVAPWYALWAFLAALAARRPEFNTVAAVGYGAVCLATAAACFLLPGALFGQIIQGWTALAWLVAFAAAGGAVAGAIGYGARTPACKAVAVAAAQAAFLAEPALRWNQSGFPVALGLGCAAVMLLQVQLTQRDRLLTGALTVPFTVVALSLVLAAPRLLTSIPVT